MIHREILDEHPEVAARVVELFGLGMATRQERLTKSSGGRRFGRDQLLNPARDLLQSADEGEARAVVDELAGQKARSPQLVLTGQTTRYTQYPAQTRSDGPYRIPSFPL